MSAFSTLRITRTKALEMLLGHVMRAPDDHLARWLDDVLRERLYNARVVPDGEANDEDRL